VVPLAGHERFLTQQLQLLIRAKEKATSTPVYTALVRSLSRCHVCPHTCFVCQVALGTELQGLFNELVVLVQQVASARGPSPV
jgi:hypothetical protein